MNKILRPVLVVAFLTTLSIAALATPFVYTVSGVGSGTLDGLAFTDQMFSLVALADTSGVAPVGDYNVQVYATSASVSVPGLGGDSLTGPVRMFVSHSNPYAAILPGIIGHGDLFIYNSAAFGSYGLVTAIGPVGGDLGFSTNTFSTGGGTFMLTSVSSATFSAQPTPEPSALAVLSVGALGGLHRRKRVRVDTLS